MNPQCAAPPASACTPDPTPSATYGPDRIARTHYDAADQVVRVESGVGTALRRDDVRSTYGANGEVATVTDANGNMTTYEYDGHGRLERTRYPSKTTDGVSSTTDDELLAYDPGGNVTSRTLRDGAVIAYVYDDLGRLKTKTRPGEPLVSYSYDLLGRLLSASQPGHTLSFTYDALGRNLTQSGPLGIVTSQYDLAGRRTRITYPGTGLYVNYDHLVTGEVTKIRENGAASGVGVLASYGYDDLGRRTSLTRGNGAVTGYGYDAVSRLDALTENLAGTASDVTRTLAYNPASQITSVTRSNDAYAWSGHVNLDRDYSANGLNQYTLSGAIVPTYDAKGNLTQAGGATYTYSSENLLTTATGGIALAYDPLNRLYQTSGGSAGVTKLAYDGAALIAEYNSANGLLRRYVHGPGLDEPLVWYEGAGVTDRRWLHSDERGSIVAVTSGTGAVLGINSYDEYGIPADANLGRFQYTGQTWIADDELLAYDPGGNVTSRTLRDGAVIAYAYDDLGRLKTKTRPGEPLVSYSYDLLGRLLSASQPGHTLSFTCDASGRNLSRAARHGDVAI